MTKKKPNKPVPGDEGTERMGMPSAARDAALEEAAAELESLVSGCEDPTFNGALWYGAEKIRRLKSIAGPVASATTAKQGDAHALAVSAGFAYQYDERRGVHHYRGEIEQIEKLIALATPAPVQQAAPSAPTDISAQLREYAGNPGYSHNDYADTMRQAADEIERYYGGMLARKKSAKKSDARAAAPAQPVGLSDERISQIAMEIGMGTTSYELDPGAYCRRFARAILAAKEAP